MTGKPNNLPWLRIDLLELQLMGHDDLSLGVENEEPGAGGSLVNGTNKGVGMRVLVKGRHVDFLIV
jgi:hypothetical protein